MIASKVRGLRHDRLHGPGPRALRDPGAHHGRGRGAQSLARYY